MALTPEQMEDQLLRLTDKVGALERKGSTDYRIPILATDFDVEDAIFLNHSNYIVKTADESVTSSTTLQDDNDLLFPIAADETWIFEIQLFVTGNQSGDIKVDITGPSGVTVLWYVLAMSLAETGTGSVDVLQSKGRTASSAIGVGIITGNTSGVLIRGTASNGATVGNIQLAWAQQTSNGTATIVKANSSLGANRI